MRGLALAAAAALASVGGLAGVGFATGEAPGLSQQTQKAAAKQAQNPLKESRTTMRGILGSGIGTWGSRQRRAAYGWTTAHAQRVARKRRNVKRHKASRR